MATAHRSKQKSALLLESIKQAAQDDDEVFQLISQNPHWQLAGTGEYGMQDAGTTLVLT